MSHSPTLLAGFLGMSEMWIILALALLFFGASRLPGIARSLGKSVNEFKAGMREDTPAAPSAPPGKDAADATRN